MHLRSPRYTFHISADNQNDIVRCVVVVFFCVGLWHSMRGLCQTSNYTSNMEESSETVTDTRYPVFGCVRARPYTTTFNGLFRCVVVRCALFLWDSGSCCCCCHDAYNAIPRTDRKQCVTHTHKKHGEYIKIYAWHHIHM